jgi:uncharacterized protein YjbJ (UPF0337 family)
MNTMKFSLNALKSMIRLASRMVLSVFCLLTFSLAWGILVANSAALASPLPLFASTPTSMKDLANEVEESVDEVGGAGAAKRIEGRAEEGIGTVERNVGELRGKVEGTGKQVEGRAKRDLGRTQGKAEDIRTEIQEAVENVSDRIKEVFTP